MKSLFDSVSILSVENEFSIQYQILGIGDGWGLMEKLKCDDDTKRKLALYVSHAYSYDSRLLQKKKERWDVKITICDFVKLEVNGFVENCIRNKNIDFNRYITFWLKETQDRDFAILISLEDTIQSLLELNREGIDATIECESMKETAAALKYFQKVNITIKSDAMKRVLEMRNQIKQIEKELEKKYDYLIGIVKDEMPNISENLGWAERMVLKRKNNESK